MLQTADYVINYYICNGNYTREGHTYCDLLAMRHSSNDV